MKGATGNSIQYFTVKGWCSGTLHSKPNGTPLFNTDNSLLLYLHVILLNLSKLTSFSTAILYNIEVCFKSQRIALIANMRNVPGYIVAICSDCSDYL